MELEEAIDTVRVTQHGGLMEGGVAGEGTLDLGICTSQSKQGLSYVGEGLLACSMQRCEAATVTEVHLCPMIQQQLMPGGGENI